MTIQINGSRVAGPRQEQARRLDGPKPVAGAELDALVRVIKASVIPKITQVHTADADAAKSPGIREADVDRLLEAVLGGCEKSAENLLKQHLDAGVGDEQICLELLAPAAARLGSGWLSDDVSFYQVTTGAAQLQSLLRSLDRLRVSIAASAGCGRKVILCGAPGEQHLFGLAMLEFFFRREGWDAISTVGMSRDETLNILKRSPCDLVAFSCSCSGLLDGLASAIQLTRSESIKHDTKIMVGGQLFSDNPDLVSAVGCDAGACDAAEAVRVARSLVDIQHVADA